MFTVVCNSCTCPYLDFGRAHSGFEGLMRALFRRSPGSGVKTAVTTSGSPSSSVMGDVPRPLSRICAQHPVRYRLLPKQATRGVRRSLLLGGPVWGQGG